MIEINNSFHTEFLWTQILEKLIKTLIFIEFQQFSDDLV